MKRICSVAALLVLVPSLAFAGWNLRQNDDGTADFVNGDAEAVPVGADITVNLENVSTASTTYVVSPVDGDLATVWSALHGAIATHDISLTISVAPAGSTTFTDYGTPITVAFTGSAAGTVDSVTLSNQEVEQGGVIAIRTSGYSTNDVDATVTIRVEGK